MFERGSGILLHVTSLPSKFAIGDLGPEAYKFADFLTRTRQKYWQILPLTPTATVLGNSPYSSSSAFAGNPVLISPERLIHDGLISPADIANAPSSPGKADYEAATKFKDRLLRIAFENFKRADNLKHEYERFQTHNHAWLEDYALFAALKTRFVSGTWLDWPEEIRDRTPEGLEKWRSMLGNEIYFEKFRQFIFYFQWCALREYCNARGISIIGDLPIYVEFDSADVWANPWMFKLDENKRPVVVAGVPPDYFSKTGQRWGNPVYDWDRLRDDGFSWWVRRLDRSLKSYDMVRLDHFRGFAGCWEIPVAEETAVNGTWVPVPAYEFFDTLRDALGSLPIIAEDLGTITDDVHAVMDHYGFPGMKVLLFAFGDDPAENPYAPHNYERNAVVYVGTHDNNTARGWFRTEARKSDKKRLFRYLGRKVRGDRIARELARLAQSSVADVCILTMQDLLNLTEKARMNTPAKSNDNWLWRLDPAYPTPRLEKDLMEITETYAR